MLYTKSFASFAFITAIALYFGETTLAETVQINSVSCGEVNWSIELTPGDYVAASYAKLGVFNDADPTGTDGSTSVPYYISSTGDISNYSVPFTFTDTFTTPPGGTTWDVGVVLYDITNTIIPADTAAFTYANPCTAVAPVTTTSSASSSSSTTSTSSSSSSSASHSSSVPTPTPVPKSNHLPAIIGGIVGAVALALACFLFLFLRRKQAQRQINENRSSLATEKGYASGPMSSVAVLPHSQSYGSAGHNEEIAKENAYFQSAPPPSTGTFSSPPTSPRVSATRPMSNVSSNTNTRGNNPLLNRQQISSSGWSTSGPLAEPM